MSKAIDRDKLLKDLNILLTNIYISSLASSEEECFESITFKREYAKGNKNIVDYIKNRLERGDYDKAD